jgi:drug/metabolite transporter (DMT)-like permease
MRHERELAILSFAAICLIWGTTFLAIRVAIETMPTLYLTGLRFLLAGAILLGIAVSRGDKLPRRVSQWAHEGLTGILLVPVANGSVVWAEHFIASGQAALLAATVPLWMALLERVLIGNERLSPMRIAGLLVGFCGVAALVSPAIAKTSIRRELMLGVVGMQVFAIAWNLGTLRVKYRPSGVAGPAGPALQMFFGGAITTIAAAIVEPRPHVTMRSGLAFAHLVVFGSVVAFTAYQFALRTIPPGRLTLYAYVTPAIAAIAGAAVLHERITLSMLAGMLLILGGVALARRSRG